MQTEHLIEQLASGLRPVRVLRPPWVRATAWLLAVAASAAVLVRLYAHLDSILPRMAAPRVAIESAATALTAIAAIMAAFQLSMPDRSPRWAWRPVPALLVWLAASGLGCLHNGVSLPDAHGFMGESPHCFAFITIISIPLALGLFAMLRRARPINPLPVAVIGALGVAATAAFVLQFFHPFDVTLIDLSFHLAAVGLVVLLGTAGRRPLLDAA